MRKSFIVLVLCILLLGLLAPPVTAQWRGVVLPDAAHIPHEVLPGDDEFTATFGSSSFADLWVDAENTPGHYEIPGSTRANNPNALDDFLRGIFRRDTSAAGPDPYMVGFPIGFTFKFMQGPPDPVPGYNTGGAPPPNWPSYLSDKGYDRAFIAINGFIIFDDPDVKEWVFEKYDKNGNAIGHWVGMGQANWWPWQLPIVEPPNNFIAPYWTDLAVGDNDFWNPGRPDVQGDEFVIHRPRGRITVVTTGTAPNRRWVVQWLNARNPWTGFLATFELQLFEGSDAILFLYKDFESKGGPYFEYPSALAGMEDYFGAVGVGALAINPNGAAGAPWSRQVMMADPFKTTTWVPVAMVYGNIPQFKAAGDMVGFVY